MLADPFLNNTIDNMFVSASSVLLRSTRDDTNDEQSSNNDSQCASNSCIDANNFFPGMTNGNNTRDYFRYFKLFPYLNDDLKFTILSFIADAPFETLPENYPVSTLTHNLPQVNRKFRTFAESDIYWKDAIERCAKKESVLWTNALNCLCYDFKVQSRVQKHNQATYQSNESRDDSMDVSSSSRSGNVITNHHRTMNLIEEDDETYHNEEETIQQLIDRTYRTLSKPKYKYIYTQVVSGYLRYKGPIYEKEGHVVLGTSYDITLNEPKYRLMMNDIMKNYTVDQRRNGARIISNDDINNTSSLPIFIHANRFPLVKAQPAVLVQVVRCFMHPNGTIDVTVIPFQHIWIERLHSIPNSFGLRGAQVLKMGKQISNQMNFLARQEALVQVMDNMTRDFEHASSAQQDGARPITGSNTDDDDDSVLSNQYEVPVTDDDDSSSDDDSSDSAGFVSTDSDFDSSYYDDDDDDDESIDDIAS